MLRSWKWLGAGLMALAVSALACGVLLTAANAGKHGDGGGGGGGGPTQSSPVPGVVLTSIGTWDQAYASFLDPTDGDIIVVGSSASSSSYSKFAVLRYTASGTLDKNFGTGGAVTTSIGATNAAAFAAAPDLAGGSPTGKIVAGGQANAKVKGGGTQQDFALARYSSTGSLDTSFGAQRTGIVQTDLASNPEYILGVAVQDDGKILAAGPPNNLVRYTADGKGYTAFANVPPFPMEVLLHPAGILAVAPSGVACYHDADGTPNTDFGSSGIAPMPLPPFYPDFDGHATAVDQSGNIYAGGSFEWGSDATGWNYTFGIAKFSPYGTVDPDFLAKTHDAFDDPTISSNDPTPIPNSLHALAVQEDGKIVAAGEGYNHIRINLRPFRDAKLGADHKINPAWFDVLDSCGFPQGANLGSEARPPDPAGRVRVVRPGQHGVARALDELRDPRSGEARLELGLLAVRRRVHRLRREE